MDNISLLTTCFVILFGNGLSLTENTEFIKEVAQADTCITINGMTGRCVQLKWCPTALALLRKYGGQAVHSMNCGFKLNDPQVCCSEKTFKESGTIVFDNDTETATNKPDTSVKNDVVKTITEKTINNIPQESSTLVQNITESQSEETQEKPFPDRKICGYKQLAVANKILGGNNTDIDEFPWLARIQYKDEQTGNEVFACAGSLISKRFVLTAAHCVSNARMKPILVRLGDWDTEQDIDCIGNYCNDNPVDMKIKNVFIHPNFKQGLPKYPTSDIALLQLEAPVKYTAFIEPVCLPTTEFVAQQDYAPGNSYMIAGWGFTEYENTSPIKRKAKVDAVVIDVCKKFLADISESSLDKIICAGGVANIDSCRGDSGGSLTRDVSENYQENWYLFGIVSTGVSECGTEGAPGIYTRVVPYMDWITNIVMTN